MTHQSRRLSAIETPSTKSRYVQWWPHGKPVPRGAIVLREDRASHHSHYSVLIEWKDEKAMRRANPGMPF